MISKEKITITLDIDISKKLNDISENQSVNKSKFINKILKEYFKNYDING
jgi:metal-responsive CopG/Arc/MetJ family transcriptional regulator